MKIFLLVLLFICTETHAQSRNFFHVGVNVESSDFVGSGAGGHVGFGAGFGQFSIGASVDVVKNQHLDKVRTVAYLDLHWYVLKKKIVDPYLALSFGGAFYKGVTSTTLPPPPQFYSYEQRDRMISGVGVGLNFNLKKLPPFYIAAHHNRINTAIITRDPRGGLQAEYRTGYNVLKIQLGIIIKEKKNR